MWVPLKSGKVNIGANIRELMHTYDRTGKIGTSHPDTREKALKQAIAIAEDKAKSKKHA
jgi:hypothetical protein